MLLAVSVFFLLVVVGGSYVSGLLGFEWAVGLLVVVVFGAGSGCSC